MQRFNKFCLLNQLEISTNICRVDIDVVHQFLGSSYWSKDRPRSVVEKGISNSLYFSGSRQ